ncbi:NAD(+) diphosphatase [Antarcticirhabdus aurantiaca]|uniref:NAD(+) diphosphatase n=1 Tax=Antarcticirhabdus aurantiaca TaxID=2606717 RepID=A0ACD4NTL0_9HYPH|nr:NAD(+) diphosphatase [Antarcticirhabdus aurantiaca]WAJ30157.1 NAD(+) diphosphatase [Jeongeuplla avenae]
MSAAADGGRMGFAGAGPVRNLEHRPAEALTTALEDTRAAYFLRDAAGRWLTGRGGARFSRGEAEGLGADLTATDEVLLLGEGADGAPLLATSLPREVERLDAGDWNGGPEARSGASGDGRGVGALDLRTLAMRGLAPAGDEAALGIAQHLFNWHARNRFCGTCGGRTVPQLGGARRLCTACNEIHFPRTDPVTIMLVHDGAGNCVLGRQPRFAPGMWSCLAGFVEPAETIEAAVRRETMEEAGLVVSRVDYRASQPWPFPGSLMIGCIALAEPGTIVFDAAELEACRWFERGEVAAMLAGTHPDGLTAPLPFAIAHHLIRAFADGVD